MSDLRSEFERAYKSAAELGCFTPDLRLLKNGDYMQPSVYWAFWAWQASRAAIKVELPSVNDVDFGEASGGDVYYSGFGEGFEYASGELVKILDEAGISHE